MSFVRTGTFTREIRIVCRDCKLKLKSRSYPSSFRNEVTVQESLCGSCRDKERKSLPQEPVSSEYVDLFEYFK